MDFSKTCEVQHSFLRLISICTEAKKSLMMQFIVITKKRKKKEKYYVLKKRFLFVYMVKTFAKGRGHKKFRK